MARKKRKKKGSFKRRLMVLGAVCVLFLLLVFVAITVWLKPLIRKGVETYGPDIVDAELKVDEVTIGPYRGLADIKGLVVGNPEGFKEPTAIDAKSVEVRLRLRSLLTDTVVIKEILIEEPVITYEKGQGSDNLRHLQKNAMEWAKSLSSGDSESSKKVVIERFRVRNGTLRVKLPGLPAVPVRLADIERRNIGGESSDVMNFGQATEDLLGSLHLNASDAVAKAGDSIEKAGKEALESGKDLGDKAIKGAGDAIKGLFGQ